MGKIIGITAWLFSVYEYDAVKLHRARMGEENWINFQGLGVNGFDIKMLTNVTVTKKIYIYICEIYICENQLALTVIFFKKIAIGCNMLFCVAERFVVVT